MISLLYCLLLCFGLNQALFSMDYSEQESERKYAWYIDVDQEKDSWLSYIADSLGALFVSQDDSKTNVVGSSAVEGAKDADSSTITAYSTEIQRLEKGADVDLMSWIEGADEEKVAAFCQEAEINTLMWTAMQKRELFERDDVYDRLVKSEGATLRDFLLDPANRSLVSRTINRLPEERFNGIVLGCLPLQLFPEVHERLLQKDSDFIKGFAAHHRNTPYLPLYMKIPELRHLLVEHLALDVREEIERMYSTDYEVEDDLLKEFLDPVRSYYCSLKPVSNQVELKEAQKNAPRTDPRRGHSVINGIAKSISKTLLCAAGACASSGSDNFEYIPFKTNAPFFQKRDQETIFTLSNYQATGTPEKTLQNRRQGAFRILSEYTQEVPDVSWDEMRASLQNELSARLQEASPRDVLKMSELLSAEEFYSQYELMDQRLDVSGKIELEKELLKRDPDKIPEKLQPIFLERVRNIKERKKAVARCNNTLTGVSLSKYLAENLAFQKASKSWAIEAQERAFRDPLFKFEVDPGVLAVAAEATFESIKDDLSLYGDNCLSAEELLKNSKNRERYTQTDAFEALLKDPLKKASVTSIRKLVKEIELCKTMGISPKIVKSLDERFNSNFSEYVHEYASTEQTKIATQTFKVMEMLPGLPDDIKAVTASLAEVAFMFNDRSQYSEAQEVVSLLEQIGQAFTGITSEVYQQSIARVESLLIGVPAAKVVSLALKHLGRRFCPPVTIGMAAHSLYSDADILLTHLGELKDAIAQGKPYDSGRIFAKLGFDTIDACIGLKSIYALLKNAQRGGFLEESYQAAIAGVNECKNLKADSALDQPMKNQVFKKNKKNGKGGLADKHSRSEAGQLDRPLNKPKGKLTRIEERNELRRVAIESWQKATASWNGNVIEKFSENAFDEHIYSTKHVRGGLDAFGATVQEVAETVASILKKADVTGKLMRGRQDTIVTKIGEQLVTVKCFILADGTCIKIDAYKLKSNDLERLMKNNSTIFLE